MGGVDHRHLLFLLISQGEKTSGFLLDGVLQCVIDAVVSQVEETDITRSVAQIGKKAFALVKASSVIVMVVRKGNPKGLKTWADLTKPGIEIVALNPKTSGNARWGLLAGYGPLAKAGDQQAADDYIKGIVRNTKTLSNNGREATDAFVKNGIGDVLLTFENEARFANKVTHQSLTYVVPETNIKTEFPVTLIDQNVDKHGTRAVAEAFIKFLFSPEAQTIYAENGYCFATDLAIQTFGNDNCWTKHPKFSKSEQRKINAIVAEERARGCKVN